MFKRQQFKYHQQCQFIEDSAKPCYMSDNSNGINRKCVYDFLLMNNTNFHPIWHFFPVIAGYWSNFCFRQVVAYPSLTHSFNQSINQSINQSWIYIAHTRKASNALTRVKFRRVIGQMSE